MEWDSSTSDSDDQNKNTDCPRRGKRKTKNIVTPELATTCDALGLSTRAASEIVAATVHSLGQNIEDFNVNRSSLSRGREKARSAAAAQLKSDFKPDPILTLHWDGKIVSDLVGKEGVDRIAVVATGANTEKLLGVPKILTGTGRANAEVVFATAQSWEITSFVKALSYDTTAVNTGRYIIIMFINIYINGNIIITTVDIFFLRDD